MHAKTEEREEGRKGGREEGGVQKLIRFNVLQHDSTAAAAAAKVQIQLWPSQICRRQIYGLEEQEEKEVEDGTIRPDKDTQNMRLGSIQFPHPEVLSSLRF